MRVVFLHGLAGSRLFFTDLEKRLRVAGYETLSFDLLGFGTRKHAGKTFTLEEHLELVTAEIERGVPENEPLALIGHSMGGILALAWTIKHPKRVNKIILLDVPLAETPEDFERSLRQEKRIGWGYMLIAHRGLSRILCVLLCQLRLFYFFKFFKPSFVPDSAFDDYKHHTFKSLSRTFDAVVLGTPGLPLLQAIPSSLPVLRITGNEDLEICCRKVELPNTRTITLPGHHYVLFEQPAATAAAIENFLKENGGG